MASRNFSGNSKELATGICWILGRPGKPQLLSSSSAASRFTPRICCATWQYFLEEEAQQAKKIPAGPERPVISQEERAKRFLETTMLYPDDTFDAVLMWDILDYLDSDLMARLATRITSLVRESGVVFAMFHTRKPILFHRYRVLDAQSLELIPATCPFQPQRVFQNREISNLFSRYRSSKMFVGRDQLREGLFVK